MRKFGSRDFTKIRTPHTYAIIFGVVVLCWILTFLVPAGKFSTHEVEYVDSNGETKTRTVLRADTFRYSYNLNKEFLAEELPKLAEDTATLEELGIDKEVLDEFLTTDPSTWDQSQLDEIGLTDDTLYELYGEDFYDTSKKLHKIARIWGTDDFGGFGFLNYIFEGLVTGDKYGSAVGIVALILVVGGAFGIIMKTGAIDAGIYAFIRKAKGLERLALPSEIASQFFVMGLAAGITAVIFKLNGMTINDIASSFQSGVADLAGTAVVVVGMAKGILLVLGGSDANTPSALNTILYSIGNALEGVPNFIAAWGMYLFQSLFNLVVTSNSGQAALTMPIMAPLSDIVGISRQIAVLCYQLGAGFVDAFTPVSASLIGVLGVARIDWSKWAKFQIKMQAFFLLIGSIIVFIAIAINFQ
jgi:uncharacterized ion transporter superfamily protein YfcC